MARIDISESLAKPGKWHLTAGQRLSWNPAYPRYLNLPGFWDPADFLDYPLGPVFTMSLLDETGREIDLPSPVRTWYPHGVVQQYETGHGLDVSEKKLLFDEDCLLSELTIHNRKPDSQTVHLVVWTAYPLSRESSGTRISDLEFQNGTFFLELELTKSPEEPLKPVSGTLGISRALTSASAVICEDHHILPRWPQTPFAEQMLDGRLDGDIPRVDAEAGLIYVALHTRLMLPAENSLNTSVALAVAGNQETAAGAVLRALQRKTPLEESRRFWQEYFDLVPHFECSDSSFQKLYWLRWAHLRQRLTAAQLHMGRRYPDKPLWEEAPAADNFLPEIHFLELRWLNNSSLVQQLLTRTLNSEKRYHVTPGLPAAQYLQSEIELLSNWTHYWDLHLLHAPAHFLETVYDLFDDYINFIDRERDPESSGLYDIYYHTDAGFSHFLRFQPSFTAAGNSGRTSTARLKGVDLTTYIYMLKSLMSRLAVSTGRPARAMIWKKSAARIRQAMMQKMWHPEIGMFFDVTPSTAIQTGVKTSAGFTPYLTDIVDERHLPGLKSHLLNPGEFWTDHPVPTASIDTPGFNSEGRWQGKRLSAPFNGRVWPLINCQMIEVLGRNAVRFKDRQLQKAAVRLLEDTVHLVFDSAGGNAAHFHPFHGTASLNGHTGTIPGGWLIDLIIKYVAGIQLSDAEIRISPFPFTMNYFVFDRINIRGRLFRIAGEKGRFWVWQDNTLVQEAPLGGEVVLPL